MAEKMLDENLFLMFNKWAGLKSIDIENESRQSLFPYYIHKLYSTFKHNQKEGHLRQKNSISLYCTTFK